MAMMVSVSNSFLTFNSPNHLRTSRECGGTLQITILLRQQQKKILCDGYYGVRVTEGEGNLPKLVLTSPDKRDISVWRMRNILESCKWERSSFVRPDAVFNKIKPISGGIPHCFPQFGPGVIQQHGFGRNMDWSVVDSENAVDNAAVTLELKDGPYSRSMWDFAFHALYKVVVGADCLSTELKITNTDNKPFSLTLPCILTSASVTGASVRGLKGCKTLNKDPDPKNPIEGQEDRDAVTFPGFVDCVYLDAPNELHFDNGLGDQIIIKNTNWSDAVLWNPHVQMEACYRDFVCVENAKVLSSLEPGQSWTATQLLSIS
ncbi:hypothetical protein Bca52824_096393 [Brassica carinata]|uniref:glucose-6-phosphate 1-epimerase n=1 Tax=Brassica carinata TaxID=52824 RepID=A0A8X7NYH2_BRACI|nr:hypothetical protein Bca52824_096393 [Brassica carinata]